MYSRLVGIQAALEQVARAVTDGAIAFRQKVVTPFFLPDIKAYIVKKPLKRFDKLH